MQQLLDPTLDVVFRLLFTSGPDSDDALRDLLAAVLPPSRPLAAVRVLASTDRRPDSAQAGFALDLLLELDDGTSRNVQIQARPEGTSRNSVLHDWARFHAGQREPGTPIAHLRPTISILLLNHRELPGEHLHSVFRVIEKHDRTPLSDGFEMHVIELPKRGDAEGEGDQALRAWCRFFAAKTDEDRERAAMSNPAIQKAQSVLERLSADPEVRLLVQRREQSQQAYRLHISAVEDRGLRTAVLDLCEVFDITPTDEQRAELERLDRDGLNALRARLKKDHRWE